ncbi:MAG: cytochrome c biogenesis protein CcdA [Gemmatimonadota bacterium]|jgi:cytochrome c-type biogenesis protein
MTAHIGITVAFLAGILSFLSPCVLPLVPSYASFLTGMTYDELTSEGAQAARIRRAVLVHGLFFVVGFSLVFIALGASASYLGALLRTHGVWLQRVGGILIVLFGLHVMGVLPVPGLERERRFQLARKPAGYAGSVLAGVVFAAGWTPCIGPVLGGILTLAAAGGGMTAGVQLLAVYSVGLAIPFLATSLLLGRFLDGSRRIRRWLPLVNRISGAMLVLVGVLLLTGSFTLLAGYLVRFTPDFLLNRL